MKVQYARTEVKSAPLYGQFGLDWAIKLFGQHVVDQVPVFVRGKHAGQKKLVVYWEKVTEGGWERGTGVRTPGFSRAWIADWNGHTRFRATLLPGDNHIQDVDLDRCYLFAEGRERLCNERKAETEARIREDKEAVQEMRDEIDQAEKFLATVRHLSESGELILDNVWMGMIAEHQKKIENRRRSIEYRQAAALRRV